MNPLPPCDRQPLEVVGPPLRESEIRQSSAASIASTDSAAAVRSPGGTPPRAAGTGRTVLRGVGTALGGAARGFWTHCDLRTMLQRHAQDPKFLHQLRNNDIPTVRAQLNGLSEGLRRESGLQPSFTNQAHSDIEHLHRMLDALAENRPFDWKKCLKLMANAAWLWPALVPSPLLADQRKTFAYTVAAASKAVAAVGGSLLRPTADGNPWPLGGGELGHHSNEVHFYPAMLNLVYGSIYGAMKWGHDTPAGKTAERLEHAAWFHVLMALTCGAVLSLPFAEKPLKAGSRGLRNGLVRIVAAAITPFMHERASALRASLTPGRIDEALRTELRVLLRPLRTSIAGIETSRRDFIEGNELTRTVNSQMTRFLDDAKDFASRIETRLGLAEPAAAGEESRPAAARNPDVSSKVALTLFAALITGATIALIQPDLIGTVDLAADAIVVWLAMILCAVNQSATRQDAMERFKGMAATSMVMCLALGADKIAEAASGQGLIDRSPQSAYVSAALMLVMSWTLPGPAARGAELALNATGRKLAQLAPGSQRQETHAMPDVERQGQDLQAAQRRLGAMSPAEADEFIEGTGDSLHRRLSGGAAA